jgi:hypothetical protein
MNLCAHLTILALLVESVGGAAGFASMVNQFNPFQVALRELSRRQGRLGQVILAVVRRRAPQCRCRDKNSKRL